MEIELFVAGRDSLSDITELLHRAYAKLGAAGMNYVAATQSPEITKRRIERAACCWIAREGAAIAGTIAYYDRAPAEIAPAWYARAGVSHFAQFAVEPRLQRCGIGPALLLAAERRAIADGKTELACDTALPAKHLIAYYGRRGFREVARHRWPHAVYTSVVLSRRLRSGA